LLYGPLHVNGPGVQNRRNDHTKQFIRYFTPKGAPLNRVTMSKVVKYFHLAFKGMESDEIYDVLMGLLVRAINGYDPDYKAKIKQVVETIDHELRKRKQFSGDELNRRLEFDCHRHLRLLSRVGFLKAVPRQEITTHSHPLHFMNPRQKANQSRIPPRTLPSSGTLPNHRRRSAPRSKAWQTDLPRRYIPGSFDPG
jgi:hypothetical protein